MLYYISWRDLGSLTDEESIAFRTKSSLNLVTKLWVGPDAASQKAQIGLP